MITKSAVTFQQLKQLLLDLGFTPTKRGKFWYFEHEPSKTILAYRPYRSREKVAIKDLHVTRQDLDWRGLMPPAQFDEFLGKECA